MDRNAVLRGNIFQVSGRYILSGITGMLGFSLYVLADSFFIANGIGATAFAALNLCLPVYALIIACGLLAGIGGATLFSLSKGRSEPVMAALTAGIIFALIFTGAGIFSKHIAVRLGANAETVNDAGNYLRMIFFMSAGFIFNQIFLPFTRNTGAPGLAMTAMLVSAVSNIVLDYIFIYPLGWGMSGAAFATGIAALLAARGRTQQAMMISLLRGGVLLIPLLMLLAGVFQLNGIWSSVPVTEISILFIYTIAAHNNAAKRMVTLSGNRQNEK